MYIFLKQICLSHQFRQIMETQFLSFNASVTVTNFETLSACIFSWLEEYCKPQVSDSSNFLACEQAFGRAGNYYFFPQTESLFTG